MRIGSLAVSTCLATTLMIGVASPASAQFYKQHNLVSDGAVSADLTDPDLVNPWGLTASATSPWWVADNGTGKSTLYNGNTGAKLGLVVSVPGAPTGIVFNPAFAPATVPGGFIDPTIPSGYAPFGIQNLGGVIFVTYALQDATAHDDVPGEGHGYVDAFDTAGNFLRRVASGGALNSPWG